MTKIFYFDVPDSPYDASALRTYFGNPRYSGFYYTDESIGSSYGPFKTKKKAEIALKQYLKDKERDLKNNGKCN
jgi:hypothetical protein